MAFLVVIIIIKNIFVSVYLAITTDWRSLMKAMIDKCLFSGGGGKPGE